MSKRISPEARVVEYFRTASLETAQAILGIVSQVVRDRTPKPAKSKAKPKVTKAGDPPSVGA